MMAEKRAKHVVYKFYVFIKYEAGPIVFAS